MPQAASLTLKNAAAANKVFALAAPASANQPAAWFLREGANQSVFPQVMVSSRPNGARDARKVQITLKVPVGTLDANGVTRRTSAFEFDTTCTIPDLVPDATRDDAIAYASSLIADALVKECLKVGYAPT